MRRQMESPSELRPNATSNGYLTVTPHSLRAASKDTAGPPSSAEDDADNQKPGPAPQQAERPAPAKASSAGSAPAPSFAPAARTAGAEKSVNRPMSSLLRGGVVEVPVAPAPTATTPSRAGARVAGVDAAEERARGLAAAHGAVVALSQRAGTGSDDGRAAKKKKNGVKTQNLSCDAVGDSGTRVGD